MQQIGKERLKKNTLTLLNEKAVQALLGYLIRSTQSLMQMWKNALKKFYKIFLFSV